jgi:hypothetical protein
MDRARGFNRGNAQLGAIEELQVVVARFTESDSANARDLGYELNSILQSIRSASNRTGWASRLSQEEAQEVATDMEAWSFLDHNLGEPAPNFASIDDETVEWAFRLARRLRRQLRGSN